MKITACTVIHVHVLVCMEAIKARSVVKTLWKYGQLFSVLAKLMIATVIHLTVFPILIGF